MSSFYIYMSYFYCNTSFGSSLSIYYGHILTTMRNSEHICPRLFILVTFLVECVIRIICVFNIHIPVYTIQCSRACTYNIPAINLHYRHLLHCYIVFNVRNITVVRIFYACFYYGYQELHREHIENHVSWRCRSLATVY